MSFLPIFTNSAFTATGNVLRKYLKDRKGRNMEDAPRYCRIVTAVNKTIKLQKKIDELYPEIEKELIQF